MKSSRPMLALAALVPALALSCIDRGEAINLDGQDVEIVFLHTSDVHSRLVPYELDVGETDKALGLLPENRPFGGMARLSAVARQERRDNDRFVYIDTGDVFQGAPIFNVYGGEPEFRALTMMGVDVFAIGNHEFDNGPTPFVEKAQQFANFPMVAANYLLEDPERTGHALTGRIAQPYEIINARGLKVGVIGMGDLGAMRSIFKGGNTLGITPIETREILQQYVDYLRPLVDLVVVASHLGYHDDLEYIPRVEGIDIVFGGHLHIALNPPNILQDCDIPKLRREQDKYTCNTPDKLRPRQVACELKASCADKQGADRTECTDACKREVDEGCTQEEKSGRYAEKRKDLQADIDRLQKRGCHPRNVVLVHSGAFMKYIGKLRVTVRQCTRLTDQKEVCAEFDSSGRCARKVARRCVGRSGGRNDWEVVAHDYKLIPVDKKLPEDPRMLWMLEPYLAEFSRMNLLTQVVGYTPVRLKRFSAGSGDSDVGNLVAESMLLRNQVWADFALTNSLGIRSDIVPGPVDEEQLTNVFPFENTITVMYLSGVEVQEMMDFITQRSTSRGCASQAQVAGLTAVLNCGGCPGSGGNACSRQPYNGEACAQRVTIGGSGRPCLEDKDCEKQDGKLVGEICTGQLHPSPPKDKPGAKRCGQPIGCTRSYRLATNDYIARGGSGFAVLERNTTQQNLGISLRAAVKDFITVMPSVATVINPEDPLNVKGARQLAITAEDQKRLTAMEKSIREGKTEDANRAFSEFRADIAKRAAAETRPNWKSALIAYSTCSDDVCPPGSPSKCVGLAAHQVRACTDYKSKDIGRCEAIARVRASLRCVTLPSVRTAEDGRQQRVFRESTGSPAPDEPWPE